MQFLLTVDHPEPDENASVGIYCDTLADAVQDAEWFASLNDHDLDMPEYFGSLESDANDLPWERTVDGSVYRIEVI